MDVKQKYCQSCHLISRNGLTCHYENNELTDMLLMYGQCYQNAAAASRLQRVGTRSDFRKDIILGPVSY
jgi:hypothetical protein